MQVCRFLFVSCAVLAMAIPATAKNSVSIESKNACVNQDVTVGVFVTNDVKVRHIVVPVEVRAGDGYATVSSVRMGWGGRLPTKRGEALADNVFNHLYLTRDCECETGEHGFGKLEATDSLKHDIKILPFAMLLSRLRFVGADLPPGTDSTQASMFITLGVGGNPGELVIDTVCICPNHHLAFIYGEQDIKALKPEFTKSIITVGKCQDE